MMAERWVRGDGLRLHAREWTRRPTASRAGEPALLLLHGLASSSHIWDLVAPILAERGFRVLAIDQRGHGRSSKPASGYGFERVTADAATVIRSAGLRRPVVVGHSWGANVALELAVRRPRIVRGAFLLDGGFLSLRDRFDWRGAKATLTPPDLRGTPLNEFLEFVRYQLGGVIEITPEVEAVFLSLMRVDRHGNIHPRLSRTNHLRILRALWEQDAPGLLARVRVPTLVLAARSRGSGPDSAGFREEKERAASRVRALGGPVRFAWIEGIHDVPLQRPNAVASRIARFARPLVG